MDMKRFIPDKIIKIVNIWNGNSNNQASGSHSTNIELMSKRTDSVRRRRDDLNGVNVISIERTVTSTGIVIDIEKYENIRKYTISNLENIAAAIEFIKTSEIKDELHDAETITEVKFKFGFGSIRELNSHEIWELSGRFSNKSISLCFCTRNDDVFYIYWKSKTSQNLLYLKPFNEKFGWKDRKICDFVLMFLKSSLIDGHSGISSLFHLPPEAINIQLHFLADTRGYNLMLLAAEKGDKDVVRILLDYGINTELPNRSISAQILSYNNRHFEVLAMLLKDNLTYPNSIDISQCSDEIKKFYETSKDLHEAIIAGNQKKSNNIVVQNNKCRYFYNLRNESAMKLALSHKQFKIYEALLSYNLSLAPHEDILKITETFTENEKNNIRNIHANCSKDVHEQHMNVIFGNTSIYQEDHKTRDGFKQIYSAYRELNANILIKVILMVVAASKKFRVVFDISRESVQIIDPNLNSKSSGFLYMTGRIFIGALKLQKFKTRHETFGTLAHEFCHYAVDLTFNNDAKPYFKNDNLLSLEFDKINEECKKRYGEEEVIDLVYDCYPEDMHHAELIVRVPQLLMLYKNNPEKLTKIQENFPGLFKFFEIRVVPAMKKALPGIEIKAEEEIEVNDVKVIKYPKRCNFYVFCGLILALFIGTCVFLVINTRLFLPKPNYKYENLSESQRLTVMNAHVLYKGVDLKLVDLLAKGHYGYDALTSDHIERIFDKKVLNLTNPEFSFFDSIIKHDWTTLAYPLKLKILSTNITFQSSILKFKTLHDSDPSAFKDLSTNQINDILDGKSLKISQMVQENKKYNPSRKFVSENTYLLFYKYQNGPNETESFEEFFKRHKNEDFDFFTKIYEEISQKYTDMTFNTFVNKFLSKKVYHEITTHISTFQITENLDKTKIFILASDWRGEKIRKMERLMHMMKKEHPMRWVTYIDMDKAVEIYDDEADHTVNKNKVLELMGRVSETGFEQKIFDEFYKAGHMIVLWNDFYHLSPDFNNFFLDLMMDIHQHSSIQIISARTSYSMTLRNKFHVEVHRFLALTDNEDVERTRNQALDLNVKYGRRPRGSIALVINKF